MRVALIGRSEVMYDTARRTLGAGHKIPLIITAKETPEYTRTSEDFRMLAEEIGACFLSTSKINTPDVVAKISGLGSIDVALSINYSGIIEAEIISLFPLGILNAHGGDLPRYRGNACQAWAIINGESRIGLCVHRMIAGELDSGDIIIREYLPISIDTKIGTVYRWMEGRVPEMFQRAISMLSEDAGYILERQSKDPREALRCYPRTPEDARVYWTNSNEQILRLINASSEPFAGAFCWYDGQRLVIWDAELVEDDEVYVAIPGQVSSIEPSGSIVVICGKGKLRIRQVEYGGVRSGPATLIKSTRKRLQ